MKKHFLLSVILVFSLSHCGGGKKSPSPGGPEGSESVEEQASSSLADGNISDAMTQYDQILEKDPNNTEAAFGAALTRLMMLAESSPSNQILQSLGQPALKLSNFVGQDGYLAAWDNINAATITLDGFEGPFFARNGDPPFNYSYRRTESVLSDEEQNAIYDQINQLEDGEQPSPEERQRIDELYSQLNATVEVECSYRGVAFEFQNADQSVNGSLTIYTSVSVLVLSKKKEIAALKKMEVIEVGQEARQYCGVSKNIYLSVWTPDSYYNDINEEGSGTIIIKQIGENINDTVEIEFNQVTLKNRWASDNNTITLNGNFKDTITDFAPDKSQFFPFTNLPPNDEWSPNGDFINRTKLGRIFSQAVDGLTVDQLQEQLSGYIPLYQKIRDLLEKADKDDSFQFLIPKRLFFGTKDISINRLDLKTLRAGVDFSMAGLYMLDSWSFPIDLGALYNENGETLISQQELVNQLNQFFDLKADHHLDEAQSAFAQGLENLVNGFDLLDTVSVDGIIEKNAQTIGGYAELSNLVEIIQKSLSDQQIFPYTDPVVTINLKTFFQNPPDASQIDVDPFVLEDGKIKPVEAFFQKILEGSVDVDLAIKYKQAFSAVNSKFKEAVFDEFKKFVVGGKIL